MFGEKVTYEIRNSVYGFHACGESIGMTCCIKFIGFWNINAIFN